MKTLNEQFEHYVKHVYGEQPLPPMQHQSVKQAFFAGGLIMMEQLSELSDMEVNEVDVQINSMRKEILDVLKPT